MRLSAVLLALCAVGCTEAGVIKGRSTGCTTDRTFGAHCAGLGRHACSDAAATSGVSCTTVLSAGDDAALLAALASASAGACVDVAPGFYAPIVVPPGVSLLGRGADCVHIQAVRHDGGSDATLRGFNTGAIEVADGAERFHIDHVMSVGSVEDGVSLGAGASVAITRSEVVQAARYGISAFDVESLSMEEVAVVDNLGPGLWVQCASDAQPWEPCPLSVPVDIARSVFFRNRLVGVTLYGASAVIADVRIRDTTVGKNFNDGGGLAVVGGEVRASGLEVSDSADFGILVHRGTLVLERHAAQNIVAGNLRGIWAQDGSVIDMADTLITNNAGVGVSIIGSAVTLRDCAISHTRLVSLPVLVNGVSASSQQVGMGFYGCDHPYVDIQRLSLVDNALGAMLLEGPVQPGSRIADIHFEGQDAATGLVIAGVSEGDTLPEIDNVDPVTVSEEPYHPCTLVSVPPGP